jgi:hypothetical protein
MTMRRSRARPTPARRWLTRPLLFAAAVLLVIEEWLWNSTAEFLRELARLPPVKRAGDWIRRRTPHQALALFILPVLALLPLKGVVVVAFAHGRIFMGILVLVLEKLIFSAIFAALYQLTGPAVTQIGWVARAQAAFLRVRRTLHAWLERQSAFREARAFLRRIRRPHWLRRRFGAAYRMQRRRSSRFCFTH